MAAAGRGNADPMSDFETSFTTPSAHDAHTVAQFALGPPGGPTAVRNAEEPPDPDWTVEQRLFDRAHEFDFFQAVYLLERLYPGRRPVGREGSPDAESMRFRAHQSLDFPASSIYELQREEDEEDEEGEEGTARMTVSFMGLTGPSGVLPRHYTERLIHVEHGKKGPEKYALRDWLDLFNHRFISLFFRAWEKYRFWIPYARREYANNEPDTFTNCLFSLIGQGMPSLRNRLRVSVAENGDGRDRENVLARIDDLALLHYSGLLSQRPRSASNLQALLEDYFQLPTRIKQFQGQWLCIDRINQSQLDGAGHYNELGVNLVVGERVWDVQNKVRICLGPLDYRQFSEFFPDHTPQPQRKAFFLLAHLVRLYLGPELDFDVQLVLKAEHVPEMQLGNGAGVGPQLGWDTWLRSQPFKHDAEDAVIAGETICRLPETQETLNATSGRC